VAFRITPDIVRETGSGSSVNGSYVFRIKYAYAQFNLDDWMTAGSWTRLRVQETPWVAFEENIYRYRFQGTGMADREEFLSSSDAGASWHYNLPQNFGHEGLSSPVYGAAASSKNPRGAWPPPDGVLRRRQLSAECGEETFPRQRHLRAQVRRGGVRLPGRARSECLGHDCKREGQRLLVLGHSTEFGRRRRLLDYEQVTFNNFTPAQPRQRRIAVHGLVNF
jgi:hypothetical protein